MTMDPEELRRAMRQWTTGVSIVTSAHLEEIHGMTVNSFTSVSLDPPLVTVTMAIATRTFALTQASGVFAVTILSADQVEISNRFAGRTHQEEDRFAGIEIFQLSTGAPLIMGGLAFLDCRVVRSVPLGPSTLFLGEVLEARVTPGGQPLVYHNREYFRLNHDR